MIQSKADLKYYLQQDKIALHIPESRKHPRPFYDEEWRFQIALRKLEYILNCKSSVWYTPYRMWKKLRFHLMSVKYGFIIPPNVFGPGLSIAHYGMLGVNGAAKIGKNCRIHEGVTIGASGGEAAPVIGDNVFIGTGAKIIGDIRIADNIAIGAGAVVVESCLEPGVTLAGNPARKISDHNSDVFIAKKLRDTL